MLSASDRFHFNDSRVLKISQPGLMYPRTCIFSIITIIIEYKRLIIYLATNWPVGRLLACCQSKHTQQSRFPP